MKITIDSEITTMISKLAVPGKRGSLPQNHATDPAIPGIFSLLGNIFLSVSMTGYTLDRSGALPYENVVGAYHDVTEKELEPLTPPKMPSTSIRKKFTDRLPFAKDDMPFYRVERPSALFADAAGQQRLPFIAEAGSCVQKKAGADHNQDFMPVRAQKGKTIYEGFAPAQNLVVEGQQQDGKPCKARMTLKPE